MNADFNNMQLGDYVMIASTVEVEDNAKLFTKGESQWIFITDFSGATGIRGEVGLTPNIQIGTVTQGTSFNVTRTGTNENPVLNFTLVKGDKGDRGIQGIQGLTGNGISSITKTGTSGLVDTYTITYTNGNTTTFTITNGEDGEVTETELDVLRQKLENQQKVIDQLPQVTGQGTSITLENTIEAQFTKFDIEGHSEQESTEGYQLLDIYSARRQPGYTTTINGVTITYNDDGTVKLNGTATAQVDFYIKGTWAQTQKLIDLVVGDIYTVLLNESTSIAGVRLFVLSNGTNVEQNTEKYNTFTAMYDGVTGVLLRIENGTALNNYIVSPMIAKGTYTKFEKYTNGASPNPNYEQPIYSAGDNENLFDDNENNNIWINQNGDKITTEVGSNCLKYNCSEGDTFTISAKFDVVNGSSIILIAFYDKNDNLLARNVALNNEKLTLTKTAPAQTAYMYAGHFINKPVEIKLEQGNKASGYSPYGMGSINEKIQTRNLWNLNSSYSSTGYATILNQANFKLKKGNYILSFEKVTVTSSILFRFFNKDKSSYYDARVTPTSKTPILNALEDIYYVTLIFNEADSLEGIQLEPGSTATQYVPHEEQDYSIFVQQPFRSIGDVRDEFVKKDGKWYERHSIAGYIITGNENWVIEREGTLVALYKLSTGALFSNKQLCNYKAICVRYSADPNSFFLANDNIRMYNDWNFATAQEAKAKFKELYDAGKPIYIHYILETPLDLPCTEEQIQQLENLPSTYKDFTIIQSEDETEAYLEVSGIYDLNKLINN